MPTPKTGNDSVPLSIPLNTSVKSKKCLYPAFFGAAFALTHSVAQATTLTVCLNGCNFTSIQTAVNVAQSGDIIKLEGDSFSENVIIKDKTLDIEGRSSRTTLRSRSFTGTSPLITSCALPNVTIHIANVTLTGAVDQEGEIGSGYRNFGCTVELNNSVIRDNQGSFSGGIMNSGTLTLSETRIADNSGENGPGGVMNTGTLILTNSTVYNNVSEKNVGGIGNEGRLLLQGTTVTNNHTVTNLGFFASGGIYNNGDALLENSIIANNRANNSGGGIYNDTVGVLTLRDSLIDCNVAMVQGGGIFNLGRLMSMNATKIRGNTPENCHSSNHDFSCAWVEHRCSWWD